MGPSKTGADDEAQSLAPGVSLGNDALETQCAYAGAAAVTVVDDGERLRAQQPIQQRRAHEAGKAASFRILRVYVADDELRRRLRGRLDENYR